MDDGSEERERGPPSSRSNAPGAEQSHEAIARAERSAALTALASTREEERSQRENVEKSERNSASVVASPYALASVKLRLGGVVFEAEKESLLRFDHTFFHGLFSSGVWQPEADGAYFIDRPAMGFDRILEYLSAGKLRVEGLTQLEEECVYSSLDYLLIPYKRQWHYTSQLVIDGFNACFVCELKDGRLCGAHKYDIIVWNVDTSVVEMTMKGHTHIIRQVIQLHDCRVCSCSIDTTIKLWSIDSGLCELTMTGHTSCVYCIIQLSDGRLCSGSEDDTIRVWNISTGVFEMTMNTRYGLWSLAQLVDGRICCGDSGGIISIFSLLTGECELSWKGHRTYVQAIVCIDATRVCSGSLDSTVKVWKTATGECERTLEGHTGLVTSMVLMQDGRLCSVSYDRTLKLWNLETGECVSTLNCTPENAWRDVCQLEDGRLVCAEGDNGVRIWS